MNDEKKFVNPTAEILEFKADDIITMSGNETKGWYDDGYQEEW